jgi:hypothetical protein
MLQTKDAVETQGRKLCRHIKYRYGTGTGNNYDTGIFNIMISRKERDFCSACGNILPKLVF